MTRKKSVFDLLLSGNRSNTWAVPRLGSVVFGEVNADNEQKLSFEGGDK